MATMIRSIGLTALFLVVSSIESTMDKRDTFSPFDSKDTPSVFTKADLKDALLVARLKSERALKSAKTSDPIPFRPALSLASIAPPPKITKPDYPSVVNKSNKKDGSLYYYYYPSESENKEIYVDAPSYGVYDLEAASSYDTVGGSGFFDMKAEHTRYLIKVALPLFVIGGILFGLSAFSSGTSRSLDEHESILSQIEAEMGKISEDYFPVSDECLDRIICEMGYATAGSPFAEKLLSLIEGIFPPGISEKMDVFKSGALNKSGAKMCPVYGCQLPQRNEVKKTS